MKKREINIKKSILIFLISSCLLVLIALFFAFTKSAVMVIIPFFLVCIITVCVWFVSLVDIIEISSNKIKSVLKRND